MVKKIAANSASIIAIIATIRTNMNNFAIRISGVGRNTRMNIPPTFITLNIMFSTVKTNVNSIAVGANSIVNVLVGKILIALIAQGIMLLKTVMANVGEIANVMHGFNMEKFTTMLARAIIFIEAIITNKNPISVKAMHLS